MKEGYERDFLRYLQSLLAEVERRIRRGHARLALSQAQQNSGVCGLMEYYFIPFYLFIYFCMQSGKHVYMKMQH